MREPSGELSRVTGPLGKHNSLSVIVRFSCAAARPAIIAKQTAEVDQTAGNFANGLRGGTAASILVPLKSRENADFTRVTSPIGRSSRRQAAAVIGDLGEAARAPRVCVRIEIKVNRHSYSHSRARLAATSETAKIAWKL